MWPIGPSSISCWSKCRKSRDGALAGAAVADLDLLDRLRPLGEPGPEPERARASAASRAPAHRRARRSRAPPARPGCRRRARCSTPRPAPAPAPAPARSARRRRSARRNPSPWPGSIGRACRLSSRRRAARLPPATAGGGMSESWLWMTAADLGRGIAAGAIDPRELDRGLPRRHRQPPAGAGDLRPHHARARPRRGRRRRRTRAAPGCAAARSTACRSAGRTSSTPPASPPRPAPRSSRGRVPERDAAVLATATRAGLVCLGKTHLTELAFSVLGLNPITATPPNINDPELAPGGSSSGAAASVAFGLAAAAIGSDTAGSVRVPAAWNDLVGLKTTHGALPLDGVVPLRPDFDTVGPLCRSVEDAALLLAALGGRTPRPTSPAPGSTASGSSPSTRRDVAARPATAPARPSRPRSAGWRRPARGSSAGAAAGGRRDPRARAGDRRRRGLRRPGATRSRRGPEVMFAADPRPLPRRRRPAAADYVAAWRRSRPVRARVARGRRRLRRRAPADHRQPAARTSSACFADPDHLRRRRTCSRCATPTSPTCSASAP